MHVCWHFKFCRGFIFTKKYFRNFFQLFFAINSLLPLKLPFLLHGLEGQCNKPVDPPFIIISQHVNLLKDFEDDFERLQKEDQNKGFH
jgi:hypothetical protein